MELGIRILRLQYIWRFANFSAIESQISFHRDSRNGVIYHELDIDTQNPKNQMLDFLRYQYHNSHKKFAMIGDEVILRLKSGNQIIFRNHKLHEIEEFFYKYIFQKPYHKKRYSINFRLAAFHSYIALYDNAGEKGFLHWDRLLYEREVELFTFYIKG